MSTLELLSVKLFSVMGVKKHTPDQQMFHQQKYGQSYVGRSGGARFQGWRRSKKTETGMEGVSTGPYKPSP